MLLLANSLAAILILQKADGYAFYQGESERSHVVKQRKRGSLWRYFFRYLSCHRNYLVNTAVMWCVAIVMPYFLREMAGLSIVPVGFAILSLNTPICILGGSLFLSGVAVCAVGFAGCRNCNFAFYMWEASGVMDKK